LYAFLISAMCATCPAHLILLDLINIMIFDKSTNYKSPLHVSILCYSNSLTFKYISVTTNICLH
jgi:hypothetical protein